MGAVSTTTPQVYGTYHTPLSTIENTAMASWSGFIYQGLCALQHALKLLDQDWDSAITKLLSLEAYEDFAVLNQKGEIESFHQCKCYQSSVDFTNECQKMSDKQEYWANVHHKLAAANVDMYMHSNQTHKLACGVEQYEFIAGKKTCDPFSVYAMIEVLVGDLMRKRNIPGSSKNKTNELIALVSETVSYIHKESIRKPGQGFVTACGRPILFTELADVINSVSDNYKYEECILSCRYHLMVNLENRLYTKKDANADRIRSFIEALNNLEYIELKELVARLFPDIHISSDTNVANLFNNDRSDYLFNVINETTTPIDLTQFSWTAPNGDLQSPSTLGSGRDPEEYCVGIVNNPDAGVLRRDYRWIVGDVKYPVEDIDEAANSITSTVPMDYTDVTKPNKIGIIDIKTKNNEDYL